MCSSLTQVLFGVLMIGAIALTFSAGFAGKWQPIVEDAKHADAKNLYAFIPFLCDDKGIKCISYWSEMKQYEKIVAICIIFALVAEIFAFVWNFVTTCSCCFKKYLIHPLLPTCFLAAIFLATAVGVCYFNNKSVQEDPTITNLTNGNFNPPNINMNTSFWMAIGALILVIADTVLASFAIFFAEHGV